MSAAPGDVGAFERTSPKAVRASQERERRAVISWSVGAAVLGLLGGVVWFYVSSSRGLDEIELSLTLVTIFQAAMLALVPVGAARYLWSSDRRILPAAALLLVGALAGSTNASRAVPGTTTDGDATLSFAGAPRPTDPLTGVVRPFQILVRVRCEWAGDVRRVVSVENRRPTYAGPAVPVWFRLDPHAGTVVMGSSPEPTGMPVPVDVQLTGDGRITGAEGVASFPVSMPLDGGLAWACPRL